MEAFTAKEYATFRNLLMKAHACSKDNREHYGKTEILFREFKPKNQ